MNKPAPKEPSMDEILSSIRQIIADDDAGGTVGAAAAQTPKPAAPPAMEDEAEDDDSPLALSAEQILKDDEPEDDVAGGIGGFDLGDVAGESSAMDGAPLVDPDDIAFMADQAEDTAEQDDGLSFPSVAVPEPAPVAASKPKAAPVASAAPMPDASLSDDLAEELLEPTTKSAVQNTFARLNNMSSIGSNVTIEQMMREMLKPMLKEWLDENLPAVVERMVEREISRASRGGR